MTNIREVAKEAGVSVGTVSRVLNNKSGVGHVTRERVLAVAKKIGYTASHKRGIATNVSVKHLCFLHIPVDPNITTESYQFYSEVLHSASEICNNSDITLSFKPLDFNEDQLISTPSIITEGVVDGVLLVGGGIPFPVIQAFSQTSPVPFVLVDNHFAGSPWDAVMTDNAYGMQLAVEHLINQGHQHITLMGGPAHASIIERRRGYEQTMHAHNLHPVIVDSPTLTSKEARDTIVEILDEVPETTAVLCSNDFQALGAVSKLNALGYRIPEDLSLIGFDDVTMALLTTPPLTTIQVNRNTIGQVAVQLLLNRIGLPDSPPLTTTVGVTLVERDSVDAPRNNI